MNQVLYVTVMNYGGGFEYLYQNLDNLMLNYLTRDIFDMFRKHTALSNK